MGSDLMDGDQTKFPAALYNSTLHVPILFKSLVSDSGQTQR